MFEPHNTRGKLSHTHWLCYAVEMTLVKTQIGDRFVHRAKVRNIIKPA